MLYIYILRSDNSAAPAVTPPAGPPAGPQGPGGPQGPASPQAPAAPQRVLSRSGRTIELAAARSTIRRGQRTRIRGLLEAFANESTCVRRVVVQLQRRFAGSVRYRTVERLRTSQTGAFSLRVRPRRTTFYRARVVQTAACAGAVSDRERLGVRRR